MKNSTNTGEEVGMPDYTATPPMRVAKSNNWSAGEYEAIQALMRLHQTDNYNAYIRSLIRADAETNRIYFPPPTGRAFPPARRTA